MPIMQMKCIVCDAEYIGGIFPSRTTKYCSRKCMAKNYSKASLFKMCFTCNKSFTYKSFEKKRKFCSPKCIRYSGSEELLRTKKDKGIWQTSSENERFSLMKESFESTVIKSDGCWSWKNIPLNNGYAFLPCGRKNSMLAHRASWVIHYGSIPNGLYVLHKCDNRICTNPHHLFLGTAKDNIQDCIRKGRKNARKGEKHYGAKITTEIARKIKELINMRVSQRDIGIQFNISPSTVQNIADGKTWKDA